jgi:CRP-like cAMP-binding protein
MSPTDNVEQKMVSDDDETEQIRITQMRGRRASVSAECGLAEEAENYVKVKIEKSDDCYQRIKKAVQDNFLFSSLDEEQLNDVFDAMAPKSVPAGTTIIKQGDPGDFFYVLDTGAAEVFVKGEKVLTYASGSSFGELALMYNAPRAATVTITEDSQLWAVDRYTFQHILCADKSKKRKQYELFLLQCELFANMSQEEIHKVADVLHEHVFEKDQVVITQGDCDYDKMKFYIVEEGEAEAYQAIPGAERVPVSNDESSKGETVQPNALVGVMKKGDFFGEKVRVCVCVSSATVSYYSTYVLCICSTCIRLVLNMFYM